MKKLVYLLVGIVAISSIRGELLAQGSLWGMIQRGGTDGAGVIFQTNPDGTGFTVKKNFSMEYSGAMPQYTQLTEANGKLYGMTLLGGATNEGVIFEFDPSNGRYTRKVDFAANVSGALPYGSLTLLNGKLYGMTYGGGSTGEGVLFEYDLTTGVYIKRIDFAGAINGANPFGSLTIANGKLYGMTYGGGANGYGILFEFDPANGSLTKKLNFAGAANGLFPDGSLILANAKLYGVTDHGGSNDYGTLFEFDPSTGSYTKKLDFIQAIHGGSPQGNLAFVNDKLYGTTSNGGANGKGTLFEYNLLNGTFAKKLDFATTSSGENPNGSLTLANGKFYGMTQLGGANAGGVLYEFDPLNGSYTKKFDFNLTSTGAYSLGGLTLASNGKLYGMTSNGTTLGGSLFEYDMVNSTTIVKKLDFASALDGALPLSNLMMATNGKLYGMTWMGGATYDGVLFEYNPISGNYIKKMDFNRSTTGANPQSGFIQLANGKMYSLTTHGGANDDGVLFEYTPATNVYTKKVDFASATTGSVPRGTLVLADNGKLYGMTELGGTNNQGVLYEFDPSNGNFAKKVDFLTTTTGYIPRGSLLKLANGKLYGMTKSGGANGKGVLFEFDPSTGSYIKKVDFLSTTNGAIPHGSLILTTNGKLYGLTSAGGANDQGVLFEYDPSNGSIAKKVDFSSVTNGKIPYANLTQSSNGKLYGMTFQGGNNNFGVLFEFDPTNSVFTKKLDFSASTGVNPIYSSMLLVENSITGDFNASVSEIGIYPNPVELYLEIKGLKSQLGSSHLFDLTGRANSITLEKKGEIYRANVQDLSQGIYLLRIQEGSSVYMFKFIKK